MLDLEEIKSTLSFFDDWEDRYRYIIDLSRGLPTFPEQARTDENLVRGCASQVWITSAFDSVHKRMLLCLDSDAQIVRGLIAIVLSVYDGKSPRDIIDFDIEGLFSELDLISHLSATRGNGLRSMVHRIRCEANSFIDH